MSDIAQAEQLWTRAHEHVRRGEFADAVRDLAQAFQILQAANDPRLYEVHRRWTEVHQMYVEDGARAQRQEQQAQQPTPSVEAEAEAAANAGELERAIALYEQVVRERPTHELAKERLQELVQARARAQELVAGKAATTAAAPGLPEDDWSDIAVDDSGPKAAAPATAAAPEEIAVESELVVEEAVDVRFSDETSFGSLNEPEALTRDDVPPQAAPVMAAEDAPIGMQSLDVPFSVGSVITAEHASELPVNGPSSQPPSDAISDAPLNPEAQVALLRELLGRIERNRRALAPS